MTTESKGTTRGKPKLMPMQGGGAVREICERQVAEAFRTSFGTVVTHRLADDIASRLRSRIVDVDNPPAGATSRQVEAVVNAAKRLQKNLDAMDGSLEFLDEIAWFNPARPMDTDDLFRFLVLMQSPDHFIMRKSPATAYRLTIKAIAFACAKEGVLVSKTEGGAFLQFIENLEAMYPGLIFPQGTTPQARRDYLRESLRD